MNPPSAPESALPRIPFLPLKARLTPLAGDWRLCHGPQEKPASTMATPSIPAGFQSLPARVPGAIELDLLRAGRLPSPLERGNNIYATRAIENHQCWYSREFQWDGGLPDGEGVDLVFDGLDGVAAIWINGTKAGEAGNMLIPHRFPVAGALRPGVNTVTVGIDSAVLAGRAEALAPGDAAGMPGGWDALNLRKAPHQFGWDIMPRIVSAGIWRDVRLETVPAVRWRSVYLATTSVDPAAGAADVLLDWDFAVPHTAIDGWQVVFSLSRNGRVCHETAFPAMTVHDQRRFRVAPVDLWWPRGSGEAALYDASLTLLDADSRALDVHRWKAGFRVVRLNRTDRHTPGRPGRFDFEVNGERVFIHGSNWVPLDALHARDDARLRETIDLAIDLNCNMLRCWGGNVYESDAFFDHCDAAGILVWQDFAYACALYPQTPEFHIRAAREARAVAERLRNHPCLALWAGNNEVDMFYSFHKPRHDPNIDDRLSREVLPAVLRRHDPERDYLPSSPYYSPAYWSSSGEPGQWLPEDHLWGPRDDYMGAFYRGAPARFASEIGYHGCPARSTLEQILTPSQLWPWRGENGQARDEWLTHAARPLLADTSQNYRIGLMASQVKLLFGAEPETLEDFVWASQFSQSEANKTFVERFRSDAASPGGRSGILWWNIRDGWPIVSDAVVDYYGRRKLSYFTLRRAQADLCAMAGEPETENGARRLWMVNGARERAAGEIRVDQWREDGSRDHWLTASFTVPPGGRAALADLPPTSRPVFYVFRWVRNEDPEDAGSGPGPGALGLPIPADGARIIEGRNHLLSGPRPFDLDVCRTWYNEFGLVADV